jgi:hypothetical protein
MRQRGHAPGITVVFHGLGAQATVAAGVLDDALRGA